MDNSRKIQQLKKIVEKSHYLVCICERGMMEEDGYQDVEDSDRAYDIEERYGYASEEIFNSAFYNTRPEKFFEFYQNEILNTEIPLNAAYNALRQLEERGRLKTIITTGIYGMLSKAGCKNVIEMHGNINKNECPHCHKKYTLEYMRNAKRLPRCEKCSSVIRPGVYLYGERLDSNVITKAMEEVERSDVLLVCGSNFNGDTCSNCIQYFNGNQVVIVNSEPNYADSTADLVIYDKVSKVLPQLL